MKFSTVSIDQDTHYGVVCEAGFISLKDDFPEWPDLRGVIKNKGLQKLKEKAAKKSVTHEQGSFTYHIPILNPEKIICVGVNFPDRNAEYKDGQEAPKNMSLFIRFARSFSGHGCPIIRPQASTQLDYEGEMVIIIGKAGRHIAEKDALSHISALSICNEGTLRDWVRHAKFNVTQGKNFDHSGAMGPWLVPFTNPDQVENSDITTTVNGEVRQQDNVARMIFPIRRQISYISTFTTLVAGDIIITGTPTGAGARFDPPRFLKAGDEVAVSISGIGTLKNHIEDEK